MVSDGTIITFWALYVGPLSDIAALGENCSRTILIFNLCWSLEDSIRYLHFSSWSIMRPIDLTLLAELGKDLAGFHRVPPYIVPMANVNR